MSIRNYFRPSNRLSEPTGSISVALKSRDLGTSTPPCARSAEYFLQPVTVPPRHKNFKHTRDTFRGKCPMIVPSFFVATAYRLEAFSDSLSHTNDSPTMVASNTAIPFEKLFHGSYFILRFSPFSSLHLHLCMYPAKADYVITNAML